MSGRVAFAAASTRLGIHARAPTVASVAALAPPSLSRVRRSNMGAGTLTISSGLTTFPAWGLRLNLHREGIKISLLRVITNAQLQKTPNRGDSRQNPPLRETCSHHHGSRKNTGVKAFLKSLRADSPVSSAIGTDGRYGLKEENYYA